MGKKERHILVSILDLSENSADQMLSQPHDAKMMGDEVNRQYSEEVSSL